MFKAKRDFSYYLGLLFLILSCGSIFWCIAKENFRLTDFLVFLLFFSWGFGLLWKSDMDLHFAFTEGELESLRSQVNELTADAHDLTAIDGASEAGSEEPEGFEAESLEHEEGADPDVSSDPAAELQG